MRKSAGWGLAILLMAVGIGVVTFWAVRALKANGPHETMLDALPELGWVRQEFHLSDEQFAKVRDLHASYRPKCVEMCDRIQRSHEELERVSRDTRSLSLELKDAIERHAAVHAECQEAMVEHLYQTAAVLDEEQGKRYLDAMLPYALDFSHSEPASLHDH